MSKMNAQQKQRFKILLVIDCILLAVAIGLLFVVIQGKNKPTAKINLNEYLTVSFEGEDGDGIVDAVFDANALINNNEDAFKITKKNREKIASMMGKSEVEDDQECYNYLFSNIFFNEKKSTPFYVTFTPETGLANGDTVSVEWTDAKEVLENVFPVTISCSSQNLEVTDLKEKKKEETKKKETTKTPTPTPKPTKTPTKTPTPEPTPEPSSVEYISIPNGLQAPADCFIFPYSSSSYLTYDELDAEFGYMDMYDAKYYSQLAIDEIFFRYGWAFNGLTLKENSQKMLNQFNKYDWYQTAKNYYPNGVDWYTFQKTYMNSVENANIDLICQWQYANIPEELW